MGVKVRNLSPYAGGGSTALPGATALSFADAFTRADTARGLGPNWYSHHGLPTSAGVYSLARIFGSQLQTFNQGGAGNPNPGSYWLALPTITALYGAKQFAQMTLSAIVVATGPATGPAVMITSDIVGNTANGYNLEVTSAITAELVRFASGAFNIIGSMTYVVAAGDVLRIEVTPTAGQNVIIVKRNGVTIDTITDINAARPVLTGCPGFFTFSQNGDSMTWDDFSCGIPT